LGNNLYHLYIRLAVVIQYRAGVSRTQTDERNWYINIVRCIHVWMQNLSSKIFVHFRTDPTSPLVGLRHWLSPSDQTCCSIQNGLKLVCETVSLFGEEEISSDQKYNNEILGGFRDREEHRSRDEAAGNGQFPGISEETVIYYDNNAIYYDKKSTTQTGLY